MICLISFSKLSDLFSAVTTAMTIGNLWSICLGVNMFIALYLTSDTKKE